MDQCPTAEPVEPAIFIAQFLNILRLESANQRRCSAPARMFEEMVEDFIERVFPSRLDPDRGLDLSREYQVSLIGSSVPASL
jgi:hypothetical protein